MISQEKLMKTLIKGKYESYIRQNSSYNPYTKSVLYDWEFKLQIDDLIYNDYFRGFNPYSGVEYIYENNIFQYETYFQGDVTSLLQIENFYYNNLLVAQQMTSGRLKQSIE